MNPALRRTGIVALILLGTLLLRVTWVQFFTHDEYDRFNTRTLLAEYEVPRGQILAGDVVIAQSLPNDPNSNYKYYRDYPEGDYFGNITGYKSNVYGATGIEYARNSVLNGTDSLFFLDEITGSLTGETPLGGNVSLTIDADLQRAAYDALAATGVKSGAVVIEPSTGRILAQASYPGWNPTAVSSTDSETSQAAWIEVNEDPDKPSLDRTRSEFRAPGSTFKTVVAAAFIEGGHGDADSMVPAGNGYTAPNTDHEITNSNNQCPNAEYTLREAFAKSCNTTFAQLCTEILDAAEVEATAAAFGFGEEFSTPLGSVASDLGDTDAFADPALRAQACIGQQDVKETVLQNAIIAATIANDGNRMDPQLINAITDSEGETLQRGDESSAGRSVSASTAEELRDIMEAVVDDGTGTNAQVSGYTVGGKTGTAQHGVDNELPDHGWFHGWAQNDDGDPAVAVCVFLDSYGGGGSGKAAEISGDLMDQVLSGE